MRGPKVINIDKFIARPTGTNYHIVVSPSKEAENESLRTYSLTISSAVDLYSTATEVAKGIATTSKHFTGALIEFSHHGTSLAQQHRDLIRSILLPRYYFGAKYLYAAKSLTSDIQREFAATAEMEDLFGRLDPRLIELLKKFEWAVHSKLDYLARQTSLFIKDTLAQQDSDLTDVAVDVGRLPDLIKYHRLRIRTDKQEESPDLVRRLPPVTPAMTRKTTQRGESPRHGPSEPERQSATTKCHCEVIEVASDRVVCWAEITDGVWVRTGIPLNVFEGFVLSEGDQFLWFPTEKVVRPTTRSPHAPGAAKRALDEETDRLQDKLLALLSRLGQNSAD